MLVLFALIVRGKPIHLVGVDFSNEKREIVAFDVQTLAPTSLA